MVGPAADVAAGRASGLAAVLLARSSRRCCSRPRRSRSACSCAPCRCTTTRSTRGSCMRSPRARGCSATTIRRRPSRCSAARSSSSSGCATSSTRSSRSTCSASASRAPGSSPAAVGVGGLVGAAATAVLVGPRAARDAGPDRRRRGRGRDGVARARVALGPAVLILVVAGAVAGVLRRRVAHAAAAERPPRRACAGVRAAGGAAAGRPRGRVGGPRRSSSPCSGAAGRSWRRARSCWSAGVLAWPSLRALDRRAVLPDPERFVLFRELDIFRPVPQPALEQLVAAARPVRVGAGRGPDPRGRRGGPLLRGRPRGTSRSSTGA